ncbi:MAG TPA: carotenoid 1,2-hydratase [Polyangiaceae bacterium]|nr:carotenoid 1,2-hydratase [Polyangiaceae bacterium]
MLGHPFSPAYFEARRREDASPLDFVALNVAIYGPRAERWVLREGRGAERARDGLAFGTSALGWTGDAFEIRLCERSTPWNAPVVGRLRLFPTLLDGRPRILDTAGGHQWCPIAPLGDVEVQLFEPALRFSGKGYLDSNLGDTSLETAFRSWTWSRVATRRGASVFYDVLRRDGSRHQTDLDFSSTGETRTHAQTETRDLGRGRWGVGRVARTAGPARAIRSLEDAPFYTRTQIEVAGEFGGVGIHESLDLDRFRARWVRRLIPFRMRRDA